MCRSIGRHGAALVGQGHGILTHCNAGGLATADYGTALAVIFAAHEQGNQAARLCRRDSPAVARRAADGMGAQAPGHSGDLDLRQHGGTGDAGRQDPDGRGRRRPHRRQRRYRQQDRHLRSGVTRQGPRHPVLCRCAVEHVRLARSSMAAPSPSNSAIPREITHGFGRQTAPEGIEVYNPAFDVTPAELIAGIITERGVIRPVNRDTIAETCVAQT